MDDLLHVGVDVGKPYLRYCNCRLRRWRWWPTVASLLRMILSKPDLRCKGCRLRLRRWRPALADLILNWSLNRDLPAITTPSLWLDERRWGRKRNPLVVFLLMADVLSHRPRPRLVRSHLWLYCPQRPHHLINSRRRCSSLRLHCRHCRCHRNQLRR